MNPEERHSWEPFLKRVSLFSGLSSSEIRRVAGKMQLLSLPKGATLFVQGDAGDALYLIASGSVRIVNPHAGADAVLAFMGRGDVLGETGLLTGERRSVTVRLDTSCEFLKLARQDFEALARENPAFLTHLTRLLSARLTASGSGVRRQAPGGPKLVTLNVAAGLDDRLVLSLHLALALLEQTKRRTVLLDLGPDAARGWEPGLGFWSTRPGSALTCMPPVGPGHPSPVSAHHQPSPAAAGLRGSTFPQLPARAYDVALATRQRPATVLGYGSRAGRAGRGRFPFRHPTPNSPPSSPRPAHRGLAGGARSGGGVFFREVTWGCHADRLRDRFFCIGPSSQPASQGSGGSPGSSAACRSGWPWAPARPWGIPSSAS